MGKQRLAIPGPTPVPEEVLSAMRRQPIGHRASEFRDLLYSLYGKLGKVFKTERPVHTFCSSGTGVMEAAVDNFFNEGERVVVLINGLFGERFADICRRYRLFVETMEFEWGKGIDVERLDERLGEDGNKMIKGVFFQQNETSTGVLNDAEEILRVVAGHGALSVVDAISGLIAAPFYQDDWGADVVLGASQKGFMMTPGLAFLSASERAMKKREGTSPRSLYFDVGFAQKTFETGNPYYTPAVNSMFGLDMALDMVLQEGLEGSWARHEDMMSETHYAMEGLHFRIPGLALLASFDESSPSVTAVKFSDPDVLVEHMEREYNVIISGGYGQLAGKIFRIAHLGYVSETDLTHILAVVMASLCDLGYISP